MKSIIKCLSLPGERNETPVMQEQILQQIAEMRTPGFFVTAEVHREGTAMPVGLEDFIGQKLEAIHAGVKARRFVFCEEEWRIYLTFFPTTEMVDERYALKNKVVLRRYS